LPEQQAKLEVGDETEISQILLGRSPFFEQGPGAPLHEAVFDEGALWRADERGIWQSIPSAAVTRMVMAFSGMPRPTAEGGETPMKIGASFAAGVGKLVEADCQVEGFFAAAAWGIAFRNGFLRINVDGSAALEPLTTEHRCRFALDFDYDPDAAPPLAFLAFVQSIWGLEGPGLEQVSLLLEWIGYLMSSRTDLQKVLLMIGPPRSGKGTILRFIQALFGPAACTFKVSALGEKWTTATMVGKLVAYDPDVRRGSFEDESKAIETILSISGEDPVPTQRKFQALAQVRLGARLMFGTNPPFRMADAGGALSTRLLILEMAKSFLGIEDTTLDARLKTETPGIVRLAVLALQALTERGRFIEPASSAETRRAIERAETPLLGFLEDRCELSDDRQNCVSCKELYAEFKAWCEETGHKRPSDATFGENLRRFGVQRIRARDGQGGQRARVYAGIKLLPSEPRLGAPKLRLAASS